MPCAFHLFFSVLPPLFFRALMLLGIELLTVDADVHAPASHADIFHTNAQTIA
jgi:hypothetical protein